MTKILKLFLDSRFFHKHLQSILLIGVVRLVVAHVRQTGRLGIAQRHCGFLSLCVGSFLRPGWPAREPGVVWKRISGAAPRPQHEPRSRRWDWKALQLVHLTQRLLILAQRGSDRAAGSIAGSARAPTSSRRETRPTMTHRSAEHRLAAAGEVARLMMMLLLPVLDRQSAPIR